MNKVKFGLAVVLVFGISGLAINKILEKPTTSCVSEVAELTTASDIMTAVLLGPSDATQALNEAISTKTIVKAGLPYIMVAGISADGLTMYVKVLLEDSATYTPNIEAEVAQIKDSMHKDSSQCSMNGKKYDIYRAKTLVESIRTSVPI